MKDDRHGDPAGDGDAPLPRDGTKVHPRTASCAASSSTSRPLDRSTEIPTALPSGRDPHAQQNFALPIWPPQRQLRGIGRTRVLGDSSPPSWAAIPGHAGLAIAAIRCRHGRSGRPTHRCRGRCELMPAPAVPAPRQRAVLPRPAAAHRSDGCTAGRRAATSGRRPRWRRPLGRWWHLRRLDLGVAPSRWRPIAPPTGRVAARARHFVGQRGVTGDGDPEQHRDLEAAQGTLGAGPLLIAALLLRRPTGGRDL